MGRLAICFCCYVLRRWRMVKNWEAINTSSLLLFFFFYSKEKRGGGKVKRVVPINSEVGWLVDREIPRLRSCFISIFPPTRETRDGGEKAAAHIVITRWVWAFPSSPPLLPSLPCQFSLSLSTAAAVVNGHKN